jgi:signal transduction histidine kinase/CheY-like chemotaxis protein
LRSIFSRLSIARKLWLSFGVVSLVLASLGLWQAYGLQQGAREIEGLLDDRIVPIRQLKDVSDGYVLHIVHTARKVRTRVTTPAEGLQHVRNARHSIRSNWAAFKASSGMWAEKDAIARIGPQMAAAEPTLDRLEALFAQEDLRAVGEFTDGELLAKVDPVVGDLAALIRYQEDVARDKVAEMRVRVQRARSLGPAVIGAAFLLALWMGRTIAKDIGGAVNRLVNRMRAVGRGDLASELRMGGEDELSQMGRELNKMIGRLRELVAAVESERRELAVSEAKAQELAQAKATFLSHMSHELRTPLNAILGYAQLMRRNPARSPEDKAHLEHVLGAGEHLLGLINDVLSLAKIEAGSLTLKPAPFDTRAFFGSLADLLRLKAESRGLDFTVEVDEAFPERVEGDEGKLRQVLVNLLGNALKFTEKGSVSLRAGFAHGVASFAVSDTGQGISGEDQKRLFESFYQAGTHSAHTEGTGLGLNISRAIVRLMGGDIRVESVLGAGSTFSFQIPLPEAEGPMEVERMGKVLRLAPGQRTFTLLVVDDRVENRELLAQLLGSVGFGTLQAADGVEAVEVWEREGPDMVWLDIRMPRLDGFGALAEIRRREAARGRPRTPVVAITASVIDQDRDSMLARDFDDYLGKPFREQVIFDLCALHLGARFLTEKPGGTLTGEFSLSAVALASLEPEWRARLRALIQDGDVEGALAQVNALEDNDALAARLRQQLKGYRLEELLQSLQP